MANNLEESYPSVDLAYDICMKSYDLALQRFDMADKRVDMLLTWFSSINIGAIAIIANKLTNLSFNSIWFIFILIFFGLIIIMGTITKFLKIRAIYSPENYYKYWLHLSKWTFKKDFIYYSKEYFPTNKFIIDWKFRLADWMLITFLIQTIFYGIWIIFSK